MVEVRVDSISFTEVLQEGSLMIKTTFSQALAGRFSAKYHKISMSKHIIFHFLPESIYFPARVITCNKCNPVQWGAINAMILGINLQFILECSSL